jgi:hypothetical protein
LNSKNIISHVILNLSKTLCPYLSLSIAWTSGNIINIINSVKVIVRVVFSNIYQLRYNSYLIFLSYG